jgi:hypothetical protein
MLFSQCFQKSRKIETNKALAILKDEYGGWWPSSLPRHTRAEPEELCDELDGVKERRVDTQYGGTVYVDLKGRLIDREDRIVEQLPDLHAKAPMQVNVQSLKMVRHATNNETMKKENSIRHGSRDQEK